MENKLDIPFEVKQFSEDENFGYFEGYASIFDIKDRVGDIVKSGAFEKSIEKRKEKKDTKLPMLWSHEINNPIGYFDLNESYEDSLGLYVKGVILLNIPQGKTSYNLIKNGVCNKMSVGYKTKLSSFNTEYKARELIEVDLYEISLVMFPANEGATILNVKSMKLEELNISSKSIINLEETETNIKNIVSNNKYKSEDFYLFVKGEQKYGLFIDLIEGEPQINIKAVLEFSKKSNIDNLSINEEERKSLINKINNLYNIIRIKTEDKSYISPYEVQQNIICDFTIKDCERFLKKSGLTNAGFKAFFDRLSELKSGDKVIENKTEEQEEPQNKIPSSPEENKTTPEELEKIKLQVKSLYDLLKTK